MKLWRVVVAGVSVAVFMAVMALAGENAAPVASTPPAIGPTLAASTNLPPVAQISGDFMKKVMETSARIKAVRESMTERQDYLYANNPEIKQMHAEIVGMQRKINAILDADKELVELKMNRDILISVMPELPRLKGPGGMPPAGMPPGMPPGGMPKATPAQ